MARHLALTALVFLVHAAAAQPDPGLRFEAPLALQAPRPNGSFAAPGMDEDEAGFAWFATESGLIRFDGLEARTYRASPGGLTSNLLYSVLSGPQGQLWVADGAGRLTRFDPLSGRAAPVTFPVAGVRALFPALAPNGTLWIGTAESELFRLGANTLGARRPTAGGRPGRVPRRRHGPRGRGRTRLDLRSGARPLPGGPADGQPPAGGCAWRPAAGLCQLRRPCGPARANVGAHGAGTTPLRSRPIHPCARR